MGELVSIAWIAQSVEHQTFNLRVQGSSPCSGELSFFPLRARLFRTKPE